MEKGNVAHEEPSSTGWGASFFVHTAEDVSAAAVTPPSPSARPSVVFSSKGDSGSPLQKLQSQVFRVLKGLTPPPEEKNRNYNPEVLTSQKRQWASFQLQALHQRILKEPSRLFESMVVVGLHPSCDIQALKRQYFGRRPEGSGRLRSALSGQHQFRVEPNLEPQVLFVYPPDKQLPMRSKDLLSFCFPGGVEVHAIERTPSMSELNEILLGQEHLKQNDQSFVFRLQGADDSILYGCCVLVDELVQQPSRLISLTGDGEAFPTPLSRHILTTRRCYCILSRLPFFELHFGVLNSIFTEERLERLTKSISDLDMESTYDDEVFTEDKVIDVSAEAGAQEMLNGSTENVQLSSSSSVTEKATDEHHFLKVDSLPLDQDGTDCVKPVRPEIEMDSSKECVAAESDVDICDSRVDYNVSNKQPSQKHIPNAILPLLRYQQYDSSDSSSSFQGSPSEDRNFRSDVDSADTEETSFSGQEDNEQNDILDWAKTNNHGSLQIICEYNRLCVPARGSTIKFHPLEHLHPLEFHRPDETVLHMAGSTVDLMSCNTSFELAEAHRVLAVEEEATALSVWAVSCLCGSLRLDHVLTIFASALLEKQIVFVCSNLGILSASVLSIISLIRPYQWQSFFMPVLPNDMLDFLDAPVPFIVGVKSKTAEVQSKSGNVILVDTNKNQVKSLSIPHFPQYKELYAALTPYHAQLVGESYLGKRRPVYDCTDVQVEAAKGFLRVLRSYLDSLCSNLRSHTITNVQSNDDKVSLLLKESFIESFPSRDRPFMKLFVDTQLFSVHTDLVLSLFQKD
ncbi:DENN (AEX-3) domain-containing protein [Artemisia annua]|uniref:DENN (AEX-3) domain-containing protein n=1 Tax=Artemisia annua TaxID=35608 RepID=A0A2U1QBZ6_ARTAN|nr:DENN (AEX-3) domain-containing protein [Artemisia annua]